MEAVNRCQFALCTFCLATETLYCLLNRSVHERHERALTTRPLRAKSVRISTSVDVQRCLSTSEPLDFKSEHLEQESLNERGKLVTNDAESTKNRILIIQINAIF